MAADRAAARRDDKRPDGQPERRKAENTAARCRRRGQTFFRWATSSGQDSHGTDPRRSWTRCRTCSTPTCHQTAGDRRGHGHIERDGTIRGVFVRMSLLGVHAVNGLRQRGSPNAPSTYLAHSRRCPVWARSRLFNRSHYETCWCPPSTTGSRPSSTTSALVTSTTLSACSRTPAPSLSEFMLQSALRQQRHAGTPDDRLTREVLDDDIEARASRDRAPGGVRNAAGGTSHSGRRGPSCRSQLKRHRNLMIATLVRSDLGLQHAPGDSATCWHGRWSDRGKTPRTGPPPLRWVGGGNGFTSLWPQCSQKRSPSLRLPWHWGQRPVHAEPLAAEAIGYRRRRRDRRSRLASGCSAAGLAAGSSAWRLWLLPKPQRQPAPGPFPSGRPSCCSCPRSFSSAAWQMLSRSTFSENSHQVSTPTISGSKEAKPKPAQTPG